MDLESRTITSGYHFRLLALAMLVGSTVLSLGLWAARWVLSRDPVYHFLGFNLFLAWLPFLFAVAMYWLHLRGKQADALLVALGIAWLLFLPVHFAMAALFFAFLAMGYLLLLALMAAGREGRD